ncbi:condensin subunit ScpA [Natronincola peptidivorans]|uniref:Segregation and condensation protein A n=1 Tax=Natronincola peptidivorans TaxID=426128 RepID=A0A1H9YM98_9FIRM|nr:segregation/condensation protein A [Natronincola peptidivorans]SES70202.1 condensin subunit ScpA [Natronincola peptidivorans]
MKYTIKIEAFEGPFDLLFHLIEKNKIDIYDIPINEITQQYLEYIYAMEKFDLNITSEFLVMAATLIEIKSKMLLPKDVLEAEGMQADEVDPRSELIKKLLEYKKYKAIAETLKIRENHYNKIFFKPKEEIIIDHYDYDTSFENLHIQDLLSAFKKILTNQTVSTDEFYNNIRQIDREPVTIEDKLNYILNKLQYSKKITFHSIFISAIDKSEAVISFLALLELIKMKKIKVIQDNCFEGIMIESL